MGKKRDLDKSKLIFQIRTGFSILIILFYFDRTSTPACVSLSSLV